MRGWTTALVFCCGLAPASADATVQLVRAFMAKSVPSGACTPTPTAVSSFSTTDTAAYLWFEVQGAAARDVARSEWINPSGRLLTVPGGEWEPLESAGNYCFSERLLIAGNTQAIEGTWTVKVYWNNVLLTTVTFTISAGGGGAGGGGGGGGAVTPAYNVNLIRNGDAEEGNPAGCAYQAAVAIPGWTRSDGEFATCRYGTPDFASATSPGPTNRGNNFFWGGHAAKSVASQTIDVSFAAADIDRGAVSYNLSGWLGGYSTQDDNVTVRALFRSTPFNTVGQASIGPVLAAERQGVTGMVSKSATGTVPAGTRSIVIEVVVERRAGSANDGYFDNISLVLSLGSPGGGGGGGGSAGGLQVNITQVIDANCPNNKLIVSVTDSQGNPITGLTASNFTLKEGGQTRSITVSPVGTGGTSGPLSLVLLIDVSSSLSSTDLANEKAAAKQLLDLLGASDQVALYSFGSDVNLRQNFTTDRNALRAAIDALSIGGSTALYKAVKTGAEAAATRSGRKAIVLMTDGEDTVGGVTLDQAIAAAKQAGAPVFTVGFGSGINRTVLQRIAQETGGTFSVGATSADLQRILQSIGQAISSQYEISYTSGSPSTSNTIELTVSYGGQTATVTRTVQACSASGGGGGGLTPGCDYFVQPLTQTIVGGGGTGLVQVITRTGCAWTAVSNVSWITILAGASGNGQGAVSYRVDPNPTASTRTGTLTIAGQTHTVTQQPGGAACAAAVSPAQINASGAGGTIHVVVRTPAGCVWTASSNVSWIRVTTATGTASGTATFTVDANPARSPRTGTVSVGGQTVTVTQAAGGAPDEPVVHGGGIVNAASNIGGRIARGSFFTIYGANLKPAPPMQTTAYPIPEEMGGVRVRISQGATVKWAYLHFVSPTQINAILPSDTPLGQVEVTVITNGKPSVAMTTQVVDVSFGIFSAAGGLGPGIIQNWVSPTESPLNLRSLPATPDQIIIIWGTGLGPQSVPDNQPPPGGDLPTSVQVLVGGKQAPVLYKGRAPGFAGVDNIYVRVPADTPQGCSVPVQVLAAGQPSNTVQVAISRGGQACTDSHNPFSGSAVRGGKSGSIFLMRGSLTMLLQSGKPPLDIGLLDTGVATFVERNSAGDLGFSPFTNLPPMGSCSSQNVNLDVTQLVGSGSLSSVDPNVARELDAGTELSISGPRGTGRLTRWRASEGKGPYLGILGGSLPSDLGFSFADSNLPSSFLESGSYTIRGTGGRDIGAFTATVNLGPPVTWTNRDQISDINRNADLTITWSGGSADQAVVIVGGTNDENNKRSGVFYCVVPATDGRFVVPAAVLAAIPPTPAQISELDASSSLAVVALPIANPATFTAPGLDTGTILTGVFSIKSVNFR